MEASKPAKAVKKAVKSTVEGAAARVAELLAERETPAVPGTPGSGTPTVAEPTKPRDPLPPKPDQAGPERRTATGAPTDVDAEAVSGQGRFLTTSQGARLRDSDHSLKAGERGPTLLQDHHLREKITHFDHERIPERVVHARGAGAHGTFIGYGNARSVTKAGFLAKGIETPVFVRFSTVLGSRGSADTVRDTRGFATKFYTDEGTFDLVGNNIPVFFIQDGIKFPDVIHAGKPHPDREIPQAQSAHDTFWDFVSLHTEAQHHTIWNMSDRGIPRSYRTMEGFGVHTFRCVNDAGETSLVKFHWKPVLGVHSLMWEEAQMLAGTDPDFHRRDLADAIEAGAFPQWELGVQVFPDTPDETFDGIDLLDPTKLVPEELAPVQPIGLLTLTAQPDELLRRDRAGRLPRRQPGARHRRHQRPAAAGAAVLVRRHPADPARWAELQPDPDQPAARARQRHAARRLPPGRGPRRRGAVQAELARRRLPVLRGRRPDGAFVDVPAHVAEAVKTRRGPASFDDHYSQARQFWLSMTPPRRSTSSRPTPSSSRSASSRRSRSASCWRWPTSTRTCAPRSRPGSDSRRRSHRAAGRPRPEPALSQVGGHLADRRPDRSGSSSTPTATWPARRRPGGRARPPAWSRSSSRRTAGSCPTARPSSAPSRRPGPSSSTLSSSRAARAGRRRAGRPRQQGRRGRRAELDPRVGCCSRSASGTRRRSARGARVSPRSSSRGSPARRASSPATTRRPSSPRSTPRSARTACGSGSTRRVCASWSEGRS